MTDLIRIHQVLKKGTRKTRARAEAQAAIARAESSRILLVDRNQHGLAARKALLEELGYDVTVTTGSIDALAAVSEGKIDVLVTGYTLAPMNGVQLIQEVRSVKPHIPIILLSGKVEPLGLTRANTLADEGVQKGASEVLHLIGALKAALKAHHKRTAPTKGRLQGLSEDEGSVPKSAGKK